MKFAMLPTRWEETVEALTQAGHTEVEPGSAEMWIFNGQPGEFPAQAAGPALPESLRVVQVPFAGVDHILDLVREAQRLRPDVVWSNAAGLYDATVAESCLGLLLAQLHAHKRVGRSWDNRDEVEAHTSFLSDGATVAIVGAGGIGRKLIELLAPFAPRVIAVNRSGRPVPGAHETYPQTELAKVWPRADYVVLLAPLTDETHHLLDAEALAALPRHAVVVNAGRGPLVDTDALVAALREGSIAGAALDVTDPEPLPDDHALWAMPNVVITPHVANPPYSVRRRIGGHAARVAQALAAGEEIATRIDATAGY